MFQIYIYNSHCWGVVSNTQPHNTSGNLLTNMNCNLCSKTFSCKQNLIDHVSKSHPTYSFKCKFCDSIFLNLNIKTSHMQRVTRPISKCPVCSARFTNPCALASHIQNNHCFFCTPCNLIYIDSISLVHHNKTIHSH